VAREQIDLAWSVAMSISQSPSQDANRPASDLSRDAFKPMCLMPRASQGRILCTLAQPQEESESLSIPEVQRLAVAQESPPEIILDFHGLDYLYSEDLSALLMLYKRVTEVGGQVVLCSLSEAVARVLELTRLNRLFAVFPDVVAAVSSLTGESEGK
jgi:anti-anti-sigma factor